MSSAAEIGASASSYQGSENLGGGSFGFIRLDTRPIEDLAKYTMLYNKSEYDQKQKDAEAAAKEIADSTSYDLTSSIPKDAKILQDKYDKLFAYMHDNPDYTNYNNREKWMEHKRLRNDLDNDIQGAKVRNIMNMARQKEIDDEKIPAEKLRLQKALDSEINSTDIRTPLRHTNQFDVTPVAYTAPKQLKFTVSNEFPNYLEQIKVLTTDMADVNSQANSIEMGLNKFTHPSTPLEEQQYEAMVNNGKLEPIESSKALASVMAPYLKNGVFDVQAAQNSGISTLSGNISNVIAYNQRMDMMIKAIYAGAFQDKLSGKTQAFGVTGLNKSDYAKIDLNKGYITPHELINMKLLGMQENITSETDLKPTDNAIQIRGQNITAAHNKAEEAVAWGHLNLDEKKFKGANADDVLGADSVLSEISSIIKNRTEKKDWLGRPTGDYEIADPTLLKEFAAIDKDGKTTKIPNSVNYDKKTGELVLVYTPIFDSEDKVTSAGETKRLNARTWISEKVKQKFQNKNIGAINNMVEQVFKKYGGDLSNMADNYGIESPPPKPVDPNSKSKSKNKVVVPGL